MLIAARAVADSPTPRRGSSAITSAASTSSPPVASSKSVLTVALQRAQSAVVFDSNNDVTSAIAAYTQSIRLLKEVMSRVAEESSKRRTFPPTNPSLPDLLDAEPTPKQQERIAKEAKQLKKDKAKEEEARRLKVIVSTLSSSTISTSPLALSQHDTYEDRVRMLISLGSHALPDDDADNGIPYSTAISPISPPYSRRRQSTSESSSPTIVGLSSVNDYSTNSVPPSPTLPFPPSSPPDNFISLPSTPIDPMFFIPPRPSPAIRAVERELGLPAEVDSTPRSTVVAPGSDHASIRDSPEREMPRVRATSGRFSLDDDDEPSELPYAPSGSNSTSRLSAAGSIPSHDRISSPSVSPRAQRILAPLERRPTPQLSEALAGRQRGKNGSIDLGRMSMISASAEEPSNPNRMSRASSRYRSDSSSSSIQRTISVDSVSSRSTSAFSSGPLKFSTLPPLPSPEERSRRASAYSAPHDTSPQRPRATRSASLATAPTISSFPPSTYATGRRSEGSTSLITEEDPVYISDSTTQGTISRRRKPPHFTSSNGNASDHVVEEEDPDLDLEQQSPLSLTTATASTREIAPAAGEFGRRTSPPQRHRALSQPSKRPLLSSYLSDQAIPSLPSFKPRTVSPNLSRKLSMPMVKTLSVNTDVSLSRTASNSSITSFTRAPFAETPMSATSGFFPFRTSPPTHSSSYLSLSPPPFDLSQQPTVSLIRRPFHLMRQIAATIETGGYITPRLYIPKSLWSQAGVKLVAVETKVRTLDILLAGLEGLEKYDDYLLSSQSRSDVVTARDFASRFVKELDSFEGLMDGIQSTLSKKLGYSPSALGGKKVNAVSPRSFSACAILADRSTADFFQRMELETFSFARSRNERKEVRSRFRIALRIMY